MASKATEAARKKGSTRAKRKPTPEPSTNGNGAHEAPAPTAKLPARPEVRQIVRRQTLIASEYPMHALPKMIRLLAHHGHLSNGADQSYIASAAIATAGGSVGQCRWAKTGDREHFPIVWMLLVGHSGGGKTRGLDLSLNPAWDLHREKSRLKPVAVVTDATSAAIKKLHKDYPRGILLINNEAGGLLGRLSQRGTGNVNGEQADFCAYFDCKPAGNHRTTDQDANIEVDGICLSMLLAVTPGTLSQAARGQMSDGGFLARFAIACPPRRLQVVRDRPTPIPRQLREAWKQCLRQLRSLHEDYAVPLTRGAELAFNEFRRWIQFKIFTALSDLHSACYARMEEYCVKFALIFFLVDCPECDNGRGEIDVHRVLNAWTLCEWHIEQIDRFLAMRDESEDDNYIRRLIDRISQRPDREISLRDLQRQECHQSVEETKALAEAIVATGVAELVSRGRKDSLWLVLKAEQPAAEPSKPVEDEEPHEGDAHPDSAPVGEIDQPTAATPETASPASDAENGVPGSRNGKPRIVVDEGPQHSDVVNRIVPINPKAAVAAEAVEAIQTMLAQPIFDAVDWREIPVVEIAENNSLRDDLERRGVLNAGQLDDRLETLAIRPHEAAFLRERLDDIKRLYAVDEPVKKPRKKAAAG